jgi:hypothetical protein
MVPVVENISIINLANYINEEAVVQGEIISQI